MNNFKRINQDYNEGFEKNKGPSCSVVADRCLVDKTDNCTSGMDRCIIDSCRKDKSCDIDSCFIDTCSIPILL